MKLQTADEHLNPTNKQHADKCVKLLNRRGRNAGKKKKKVCCKLRATRAGRRRQTDNWLRKLLFTAVQWGGMDWTLQSIAKVRRAPSASFGCERKGFVAMETINMLRVQRTGSLRGKWPLNNLWDVQMRVYVPFLSYITDESQKRHQNMVRLNVIACRLIRV